MWFVETTLWFTDFVSTNIVFCWQVCNFLMVYMCFYTVLSYDRSDTFYIMNYVLKMPFTIGVTI